MFLVITSILVGSQIHKFHLYKIDRLNEKHNEDIKKMIDNSMSEIRSERTNLKKKLFEVIYGMKTDPEIFKKIEKDLFVYPILRKNVNITLTLKPVRQSKRSKTFMIEEELHWSYELHNQSNEVFEHVLRISTEDRDEKCIISKMQIRNSHNQIINQSFEPKTDKNISVHEQKISILPNDYVIITTEYYLKLGSWDKSHRNAIANLEFVVGKTKITVNKPIGYIFGINLHSKSDIFKNLPEVKNNSNITVLHYETDAILYPGQGFEYSLQKVSS